VLEAGYVSPLLQATSTDDARHYELACQRKQPMVQATSTDDARHYELACQRKQPMVCP
jgi:hypothetical protein